MNIVSKHLEQPGKPNGCCAIVVPVQLSSTFLYCTEIWPKRQFTFLRVRRLSRTAPQYLSSWTGVPAKRCIVRLYRNGIVVCIKSPVCKTVHYGISPVGIWQLWNYDFGSHFLKPELFQMKIFGCSLLFSFSFNLYLRVENSLLQQ